jgi:MFS family permease
MAVFMAATTWGPTLGPVVSGYLSPISWRWSFWTGLILCGITWPAILAVPETHAPTILKKRARSLRKRTGDDSIRAPIEMEKTDIRHIVTVVLTRPFRMVCFEPLVLFSCIYLSFAYAVFYMLFQSFPIIYMGTYGFSAGEEGLTFLAIGLGAIIACGMYIYYDIVLRNARAKDAPWSRKEESRRLPLACVGGPFMVVACFWVGWTARPSVHWIVPVLAGIPFGIGFLLLFMALLNYLVDAVSQTRKSFNAHC